MVHQTDPLTQHYKACFMYLQLAKLAERCPSAISHRHIGPICSRAAYTNLLDPAMACVDMNFIVYTAEEFDRLLG